VFLFCNLLSIKQILGGFLIMATVYSAIRLDKVQAVKSGNIESVKGAADLENGFVFYATDLVSGEREVKTVVQPVTADLLDKNLLIHASVPTTYNAGDTIVNFVLTAGKVGRAYVPAVGDIYTVSDSAITGTSVINQFLIPANASYKLVPSATIGTTTKFSAKVIEKGTLYGAASTTFQVVKS
jgi:hypothetical protein